MSDLSEFLLARIAEDEEVAREGGLELAQYGRGIGSELHYDSEYDDVTAQPARILAECQAKRRIVEAESRRWSTRDDAPIAEMRTDSWANRVTVHFDTGGEETMTHAQFRDRYQEPHLSDTLKLLALPYADHADYREAWRP